MKNRLLIPVLLLITSTPNWSSTLKADEEKKAELIPLVYEVGDLVTKVKDYPFRGGTIPTSEDLNSPNKYNRFIPAGGGGGGGGGYGGGGGNGFNVEDPIGQAQFQVGSRSYKNNESTRNQQGHFNQFDLDALINTITRMVDPSSWEELGGNATVVPLGSMLAIRQTKSNHEKIEQLLVEIRSHSSSQKMIHLDAYWVKFTDEELQIIKSKSKTFPVGITNSHMESILKGGESKRKGYTSQITCYNGQTVSLNSGKRKTLLRSLIAVVGQGAVGYQPEMITIHSGLVLQIKPLLGPANKYVSLDIQSVITKLDDSQTNPKQKAEFKDLYKNSIQLDKIELNVQQLSTTVRIPIGEYIIVGGMNSSNQLQENNKSELNSSYSLIVRVQSAEASKKAVKTP